MNRQRKYPTVIITGMHRSGTSLVASMCQAIGIDIGKRLMGPHRSNPTGHYEDLDFYELHEQILGYNGLSPAGFDYSDFHIKVSSQQRANAVRLVRERDQSEGPWGWKDPRTVLFLDFWIELLPESKFIFVYRKPDLVAGSLFQRGDEPFQDDGENAYRLWHHYNQLIKAHISKYPNLSLVEDVDWIADNSEAFMTRLTDFINVDSNGAANPFNRSYMNQIELRPERKTTKGLQRNCDQLYHSLHLLSAARHGSDYKLLDVFEECDSPNVAVLVPIHRLPFQSYEVTSLFQLCRHLGSYRRIIVAPKSLDLSLLNLPTVRFDDEWFISIESYSRLLLSEEFYRHFGEYTYILIYQLDCLVFSSNLSDWCNQGWHYVGAPWFQNFSTSPKDGLSAAGNGGFSLRHVEASLRVLTNAHVKQFLQSQIIPEDLFWSFEAPRFDPSFIVPCAQDASKFAVESNPRYFFSLNNNQLPFGCHYWNRLDPNFWLTFLDADAIRRRDSRATSLINPDHPDSEWMIKWIGRFFQHLLNYSEPLTIARILTREIAQGEICSPPTREGIDRSFELILGRKPGNDWYDYWIGRPDSSLLDVIRDLANGEEFSLMLNRLRCLLLASI